MSLLPKKERYVLMTGNDALCLGALKAGLKFYAAYPMTPASSILHTMAASEHDYKIIVKHTEDEIAAINMVIGASIAGSRAMCGTSGGGFSLMVEGFGFGAIIETPFVVYVGTRAGPATGMPTWTGQGDFRFVMHASQDEFPRIILAPGDAAEAFQLAYRAFNMADRYQIPVIILSDTYLADSLFTISVRDFEVRDPINRGAVIRIEDTDNVSEAKWNKPYKRYDPAAPNGISPRAIPGVKGHIFLANSDEHDDYGYSEEDAENRKKQMDKRMKKLDAIVKNNDAAAPNWYGRKKANKTIVCWGSTKGVAQEALKHAKDVNVLHFNHLYPLNTKIVQKELNKIKRSVCIEGNYDGLLYSYLYEKTGYKCDETFLKYDGRPFFVEEVIEKVQ
ncbi:MAG: hypothetical protein HY564_01280 [Candidatus Jacksonbacteria bacterium]|nr:hypothetical protein [Candidatus Jacksonbacteria bacterium]